MSRRGGERGFTLIELIATMIVLSVAAAMAAPLALELTRSATGAERARVELGDARRALETIGDLLREAPELDETEPGTSGLSELTATSVTRSDGVSVRFEDSALWVVEAGDRRLLTAPVESLALRAYEVDGVTEATDLAEARRVEFEIRAGGITLASVAALRVPGATATITWNVDNVGEVFLNGVLVDSDGDWRQARRVTVALREGENLIAVSARDTGGPGGVLVEVEMNGERIGSNAAWRVSTTAPSGWTEPDFDDSSWNAATAHAVASGGPWRNRLRDFPSGSPARWIWTSNLSGDNQAYLRGWLRVAGGGLVAPSGGGAIDFSTTPIVAFGGHQDGDFGLGSEFEVLDGGATLRVTGNAWKAIALPYDVGEDTVIEFEFASVTDGEIQGVGLARDLRINAARAIQVNGPQRWARHRPPDVPAYTGDGEFQSYSVRVGDLARRFPSGEVAYLVLISDDDNREHDDGELSESLFRNVRVYEGRR